MSERATVSYREPGGPRGTASPILCEVRKLETCVSRILREARKLAACATVFLLIAVQVEAQSKKSDAGRRKQASEQLTETHKNLVTATKEYKASLEKLLPFEEANAMNAADLVEKRKGLLDQGVISKKELEDSQHALADAQSRLDQTRKQLSEADNMVAEALAPERMVRVPAGGYLATAALIRFNGTAEWSLKDASKIEQFFAGQFGRVLPISAFGQTAVHDHLGFDHHNAMDVAVHPDSPEGQALMAYLRAQGIPFIAFRYAVAGSATGAHIHIGRPSHRTG